MVYIYEAWNYITVIYSAILTGDEDHFQILGCIVHVTVAM